MRGYNIVQDRDERYQYAYLAWNPYFPEADQDLRFYQGAQWSEQEINALQEQNRSALVINRIKPNVNLITGYQRKHRMGSVVVPSDPSDQRVADQLTKLVTYAFNKGDIYETISDIFEGGTITGWNLGSLWMDRRKDPSGHVCVAREPYNAFITDPYFSKKDLSDCEFIQKRKYLSLQQAESLLPEYRKEMRDLYKTGMDKDDKFTWLPYERLPTGLVRLAYDEEWMQGWEKKKFVVDVDSGEEFEWDGEDASLLYISENIDIVEREVPYVDLNIIVNNQYIKTLRNPNGLDEYPFAPFFYSFNAESDFWELKIQGAVRPMRDPQREGNKRSSQLIDLVESRINSGWLIEEGAVSDLKSLFMTGQGKVVARKRGKPPETVVPIPPPDVPQGFFQLKQVFDQDVPYTANVSDELLGQAESSQDSGLKVMLRQSASLVGLQGPMDNLRYCQKIMTRKAIKLMAKWPKEKLAKILNEEPDPKIFGRTLDYDISVQEGVLTTSQQQLYFTQLVDLFNLTSQPSASPITPAMLIDAAPLQGKSHLMEQMRESAKAQEEQAASQAKVQQSVLESQQLLAQSQSLSEMALAKERIVKSESDKIEKAAKAVDDRADAELRRIESLLRIQELDESKIDRLINRFEKLSSMVQMEESAFKAEAEAAESTALSELKVSAEQSPKETPSV